MPAPGFEAYGETISYPGSSASKRIISDQMDEEPVKLKRVIYQGPEIDLENLSWRVLNGPFISVWLHNVPWGAENTKAAPDAEVGCMRKSSSVYHCSLILFHLTCDVIARTDSYC